MNTPITFECLEERQFLSTTPTISNVTSKMKAAGSALIVRLKNAVQNIANTSEASDEGNKSVNVRKEIIKLRANAELMGASKAALAAAIRQLQGGTVDNAEQANRLLVVDALKLPKDALRTKLSASELLQHVADLQTVGGGEKQTDVAYWQKVRFKGAEVALGEVVAENLGVPQQVAKGKKAKDLLKDAADIQLMTGDVRSKAAWDGLKLVKAGKISVEQYANNHTHGKDIGQQASAGSNAGNNQVVKQSGFMKSLVSVITDVVGSAGTNGAVQNGAASQTGNIDAGNVGNVGNAVNSNAGQNTNAGQAGSVTNTAPDTDTSAPDVSGAHSATIGDVSNSNGTSTYGITYHFADGRSVSATVTVNPDGSATVVYENGHTETYPPGSYDEMPDDASGATVAINQDSDGDGEADQGTYYTEDDSDSDDDDEDDDDNQDDSGNTESDNSSDPPQESNESGGEGASGSKGTPNPENFQVDPAKAANFYANNPIGKSLAGSRVDPVKASRGGGAGDPIDNPENPSGRSNFNNSKVGSKSGVPIRLPGGNIDYPDDRSSGYVMLDKRLFEAIRIKSGGAVGGPDAGRKPRKGGVITPRKGVQPTPAPKPITNGVFSKVAINANTVAASQISAKLKVAVNTAALGR